MLETARVRKRGAAVRAASRLFLYLLAGDGEAAKTSEAGLKGVVHEFLLLGLG
jgi:hypothetical protein